MGIAAIITGTTLLALHTILLAGLIWSLRRHGRATHETAPHAGKLLTAFILLILANLVRSIRYIDISPSTLVESILLNGLDIAAALLTLTFLAHTPTKQHKHAMNGSNTAGNIMIATAAASILFLSNLTPGRMFNVLLGAIALACWAWALNNASLSARTLPNTPAWIPSFARAGAYLLVASAYIRVFILNAAIQGGNLFEAVRIVNSATFLLGILLAWPAITTIAKDLHKRAHNQPGPRHKTLTPTAPPTRTPAPKPDPTPDTPDP